MFKAHINYNSGVFVSMELYSQLFCGPCHIIMLLLIFSHEFHILECELLEKRNLCLPCLSSYQLFTQFQARCKHSLNTLRKIDYSVLKILNGKQYTPVTCSNFFQLLPFFTLGFSYKSLNWD